MQTPASTSKHPVHPMLVVLPVGLWVFSLFCDLLHLGGAEAEIWSGLALYAMAGGFICAFTAIALPGFVAHLNVSLIVVALYAVNIWLRLGDFSLALTVALSVTALGMLAICGWLESQLLRLQGER
jgi:hypothetical protein